MSTAHCGTAGAFCGAAGEAAGLGGDGGRRSPRLTAQHCARPLGAIPGTAPAPLLPPWSRGRALARPRHAYCGSPSSAYRSPSLSGLSDSKTSATIQAIRETPEDREISSWCNDTSPPRCASAARRRMDTQRRSQCRDCRFFVPLGLGSMATKGKGLREQASTPPAHTCFLPLPPPAAWLIVPSPAAGPEHARCLKANASVARGHLTASHHQHRCALWGDRGVLQTPAAGPTPGSNALAGDRRAPGCV